MLLLAAPTVDRTDRARRIGRVREGPCELAVEADLVGVLRRRLEAIYAQERIVMRGDVEGLGPPPEDLDLAGRGRPDPGRRVGLSDVAQDGAEPEIGHAT